MSAEITVDFSGTQQEIPPLVVVEAEKRVTIASTTTAILSPSKLTRQDTFNSKIPSGYRCIGKMNLCMADVNNADNVLGIVGDGPYVTYKMRNTSTLYARGEDDSTTPKTYYYTEKATLICLRNDIPIKEG